MRVAVSPMHPALLIAQGAVGTDQDVSFVYVLNEHDEVVRRTVKLGTLHEGLQEIEKGISPDDRVVVDGLQRVHAGIVVHPKLEPMPIPANNGDEASAPLVMKAPPSSAAKR